MGHESPGGGAAAESASYEDLCRAHIEAFIAEAAAAEVQTELAARVSGWRARIAPALAAQDARGEFDIHACDPVGFRVQGQAACSCSVTTSGL